MPKKILIIAIALLLSIASIVRADEFDSQLRYVRHNFDMLDTIELTDSVFHSTNDYAVIIRYDGLGAAIVIEYLVDRIRFSVFRRPGSDFGLYFTIEETARMMLWNDNVGTDVTGIWHSIMARS
jgi:hypothetical protein